MDKLKELIKKQEMKNWAGVLVFAFCVITGICFVVLNADSKIENIPKIVQKDESFASGVNHSDLKTYFTQQVNKKIKDQESKVKLFEDNLKEIQKIKDNDLDNLKKSNLVLQDEINKLKAKLESGVSQNKNSPNFTKTQFDPNILPPAYEQNNVEIKNAVLTQDNDMEEVSVELEKVNNNTKDINSYVPSGTFVRGVILGGIDAPTEVYGNNQTRVVTIRFTDGGDMPNGFKGYLKNCVLLASAWGNSSSERVAMRGERLSCVGGKGDIFEKDIIATIYGPDGRQDVRGRVVYPEGKLLGRAFASGALSGFSTGLSNSFVTQSISPLGTTNTVPSSDVFKNGLASGAGKSLDKLSDYYIKRAEQLQPIIQVGSGTLVDVVIQKGFFLNDNVDNNSVSNHYTNSNNNNIKQKNDVNQIVNAALVQSERKS
tara:strand:+ start:6683 stop:7969 length:1287 start_codon:yes stop_codon:yes gene_type:complete